MELRGNLKDFSLPDVIQLVGFGRKTGVLRVECGDGDASLFFEEGNVVHAEHPGAVGEEAVYTLFHVPEGEFRFQADVLPPVRTIAMDATNLVMEAARLLDESRRDEESATWPAAEGQEEEEWFGIEEALPDPGVIKKEIKLLLKNRFGRGAKRVIQAVDQCGDSVDELIDLAERVEKYVHVFLDSQASRSIGQQIRSLIGPFSSS